MLGTYINCYIIFSYVIPFCLFMWLKYILSLNSSLLFLTTNMFKTFWLLHGLPVEQVGNEKEAKGGCGRNRGCEGKAGLALGTS